MRRVTTLCGSTLLLLLSLGACQDAVMAPGPEASPDLAVQASSHGEASPASEATLSHQLQAVRQATLPYRDISKADEDGYAPISPYVPGMGFHFSDRTPPFGTDVDDPPVLVYFPNGSYDPAPGEPLDPARKDDLVLGAVEYLVPGDQTGDDAPNIFADESGPQTLPTTEREGWHFERALGFSGLHAWVHRGNPDGVFHTTNRTIESGPSALD